MYKRNHVVIPDHVSHENFTATRVHVTRSHSISSRCYGITHAVVTNIVRVKVRIVGRVIFGDNYIFETCFFESDVPVLDTLFNGTSPFFRESIIHVEYNRFYRFHEFSAQVGGHVFWLDSPTVDEFEIFHAVFVARVEVPGSAEITDTSVFVTHGHGIFVQLNNRTTNNKGKRAVLSVVVHLRGDFHVAGEVFHLFYTRCGRVEHGTWFFTCHWTGSHRGNTFFISSEECSHVDQ